MKRLLLLVMCLPVVVGCAYAVKIDPTIQPNTNITNKVPLHVGVFVTQSVKECVAEDNSDWAHQYSFNMGEAIESMVYKASDQVFRLSERLEAYPTQEIIKNRKMDLVAVASMREGKVSLNRREGFFTDTGTGSSHVSLAVTFYDSALVQFAVIQANGSSVASAGLGAFTTGKREYSQSVEGAIRNLGDDLVQQMYGNYDIRKRGEQAMAIEGDSLRMSGAGNR